MSPRLRALLIAVLVTLLWLWTVAVAWADFAWDRMAFVAGLT